MKLDVEYFYNIRIALACFALQQSVQKARVPTTVIKYYLIEQSDYPTAFIFHTKNIYCNQLGAQNYNKQEKLD